VASAINTRLERMHDLAQSTTEQLRETRRAMRGSANPINPEKRDA
jgi:hypothetical protein